MKPTLIALMFFALTACVQDDCEYDTLYADGYASGEVCEDWILLWSEEDGQCAADALADGYNAARADAAEDCDASRSVMPPQALPSRGARE